MPFVPFLSFGLTKIVERALYRRDHTGGDTSIPRCRGRFGVPQESLYDADIDAALQKVGGKGMAQCVQRDRLGDARRLCCLLEQPRNLARR